MAVQLNHTIVWCADQAASSAFLARILGLPAPRAFFHFLVVDLDNGVSLDFMQKAGPVKPNHPWTNGQVERMNRTLKEATVRRYHYETHHQPEDRLAAFLDAYNLAKRLKTPAASHPRKKSAQHGLIASGSTRST
jgi:catechol 2,3-dioxygenase-like lactoylglutathione lyase family enzyme